MQNLLGCKSRKKNTYIYIFFRTFLLQQRKYQILSKTAVLFHRVRKIQFVASDKRKQGRLGTLGRGTWERVGGLWVLMPKKN